MGLWNKYEFGHVITATTLPLACEECDDVKGSRTALEFMYFNNARIG